MQLALVRIGCDLKLFNHLCESDTPLTVDVLAQKTGAAPVLLGRKSTSSPIFELTYQTKIWMLSSYSSLPCLKWLHQGDWKRYVYQEQCY